MKFTYPNLNFITINKYHYANNNHIPCQRKQTPCSRCTLHQHVHIPPDDPKEINQSTSGIYTIYTLVTHQESNNCQTTKLRHHQFYYTYSTRTMNKMLERCNHINLMIRCHNDQRITIAIVTKMLVTTDLCHLALIIAERADTDSYMGAEYKQLFNNRSY